MQVSKYVQSDIIITAEYFATVISTPVGKVSDTVGASAQTLWQLHCFDITQDPVHAILTYSNLHLCMSFMLRIVLYTHLNNYIAYHREWLAAFMFGAIPANKTSNGFDAIIILNLKQHNNNSV